MAAVAPQRDGPAATPGGRCGELVPDAAVPPDPPASLLERLGVESDEGPPVANGAEWSASGSYPLEAPMKDTWLQALRIPAHEILATPVEPERALVPRCQHLERF